MSIETVKINNKLNEWLKQVSITGYGSITFKIEDNKLVFVVTEIKDLIK